MLLIASSRRVRSIAVRLCLFALTMSVLFLALPHAYPAQAQTPPACLPPTAAQLAPATTPDPTQVPPLLVCDLKSVVTSVAFSPDGKTFAAGTHQAGILLFDTSGHYQRSFNGHTDFVTGVAFSPDGKMLASSSDDHSVRLWEVATGKSLRTLTGHTDQVLAVLFTHDGKQVLSASDDHSVRLWDVQSGQALSTFTGHKNAVRSLALSPDGKAVVSTDADGKALLWDLGTGKIMQSLAGETSAAFSPDGSRLATSKRGDDATVNLYDVKTGAAIPNFALHTKSVWSLAFSSDGKFLLTGSAENRARLWDIATNQPIRTFSGDTDWVHSVALSPDNQLVLTGSNDSTVRLWPSGLTGAPGATAIPTHTAPTQTAVPANTPIPTRAATAAIVATAAVAGAASGHGVVAVAFRLDPATAGMIAYIGDPALKPFVVPDGQYSIAAVDEQGRVVTRDSVAAAGARPIPLPADFGAAGGVQDDGMASAIKTLANFLCDADLGQLIALQGISAGFAAPLFDPSNNPTQAQLHQLTVWYGEILSQQDATLTALALMQDRAAPGQALTVPVAFPARPIPAFNLPFKSLWSKVFGFFGYAGAAGKRARERILLLTQQLTPAQRAEAFDAIREGFKGDSTNWDEFAQRLQSGELDNQALVIESDLRNFSQYGDAALNANQGTGALVVKEGGGLLSRGVDLYSEVIKTVLGQTFPDITKGFDLADKADQWATYIQNIYKATAGKDPNARRELIKQAIKDQIAKCCQDMPPETADQIATAIGDRVVDTTAQSETPQAAAPAPTENQAAAQPVPTESATSAPTEQVAQQATVQATEQAPQAPTQQATRQATQQATQAGTQQAASGGLWTLTFGNFTYAGTCSSGNPDTTTATATFIESADRKSAQLIVPKGSLTLSGDGNGNYQGQAQAVVITIHVVSPTQATGQTTTTILGCTASGTFQMTR